MQLLFSGRNPATPGETRQGQHPQRHRVPCHPFHRAKTLSAPQKRSRMRVCKPNRFRNRQIEHENALAMPEGR
jgi:hypothetical protein